MAAGLKGVVSTAKDTHGRPTVVDLVDSEEGVSPGQACVFYDAAEGQARVLGGGFIQSATASSAVVRGAARRQPSVEASFTMRARISGRSPRAIER